METLASWIHQKGPLPPRDAVGWAVRLARHLESLHQHGVAHGNVSPACLLVENGSPFSRGLVADVRRTGEMVQYHSPERLRSGQLSPNDDVWGLAATLFTALTRARPYGDDRAEIDGRLRSGALSPLASFGINDPHLAHVLGAALSVDPSRRIPQVSILRSELERWYNDPSLVARLAPLEDEEANEDDQAATAMVPVGEMMFDDSGNKNPDSRDVFAPPYFPRSSGPGQPAPSVPGVPRVGPPRSQPQPPPAPPAPSPLGEQDATVMRELPAHIMAMAARAAAGSNPPPPPEPEPEAETIDPEDAGGATRIAPAVDLQAVLQASRAPAPPAPPAPSRPGAPPPPSGPRPGPPRALRSTQLGVGNPLANLAMSPPQAPQAPAGPMAPRPGFAPPPQTVSSAPPPPGAHDDDVRTVMHDMGAGPFNALAQAARSPAGGGQMPPPQFPSFGQPAMPPSAPNRPAPPIPPQLPPDEDEDDGGRTVMRDSPGVADMIAQRAPAPPPQAWAPAAPPVQGRGFAGVPQTDRPPGFPPGTPQQGGAAAGGGVSALLQEAIDTMGSGPQGAAPMQGGPMQGGPMQGGPMQGGPMQGAPPGFPPPFEPTGGFGGGQLGSPPMGQVAGPFQPLGLGGGPSFTPAGGNPQLMGSGSPSDPFGQGALAPDPMLQQQGLAGAAPGSEAPMGYPVGQAATQPQTQVEVKPSSKLGLFIVCFLVLVLAATVTFVALRFRAQIGF
ncbi:MAG TPA: hypothetical protein VL400_05040 [Polyangiaceae bacterium]|nr:hypothetical protein [Polyangiaceae bacterium]